MVASSSPALELIRKKISMKQARVREAIEGRWYEELRCAAPAEEAYRDVLIAMFTQRASLGSVAT